MEAIQLLVQDDFNQVCNKEGHGRRIRRVFNFINRETMCTRCGTNNQEFFDCSSIQRKSVENKMLIQLQSNHDEDVCQVDNFCSLGCKVEHVMSNSGVKKKRTGGRKRGEVSIFHRFFGMMLMTRKPRSQGRRRRRYRPLDGQLPPKKRNRGG
ncbi:unnamed protein product [Arabis nemorensis]|uniref:Uncharacterized protein n=1 Tax=Arabis nemorensis TaxID=586526 RepID=A0A565CFI1_9BRAS|nr:unnamed protein product [Arabis nemorensis]